MEKFSALSIIRLIAALIPSVLEELMKASKNALEKSIKLSRPKKIRAIDPINATNGIK